MVFMCGEMLKRKKIAILLPEKLAPPFTGTGTAAQRLQHMGKLVLPLIGDLLLPSNTHTHHDWENWPNPLPWAWESWLYPSHEGGGPNDPCQINPATTYV